MERYRAILLLGPPGSGKGTQGRALGALPRLDHCSSGDIFRSLDAASDLGKLATSYSHRGELVPDDVTIQIWRQHMEGRVRRGRFKPSADVLILDGIPRNQAQCLLLEKDLDLLRIFHLVCRDDPTMIRRIQGRASAEGRPDDADEKVIRHRLDIYRQQTAPILEYYPRNLVSEIDGLASPLQTLRAILDVLIPIL